MDAIEANALLAREIEGWRTRSYAALAALVGAEPVTGEITGTSGTRYGFEIEVFWDGRPNRDVRVMGMIDDGSMRALRPLTDGFIMAPDGSFVGE